MCAPSDSATSVRAGPWLDTSEYAPQPLPDMTTLFLCDECTLAATVDGPRQTEKLSARTREVQVAVVALGRIVPTGREVAHSIYGCDGCSCQRHGRRTLFEVGCSACASPQSAMRIGGRGYCVDCLPSDLPCKVLRDEKSGYFVRPALPIEIEKAAEQGGIVVVGGRRYVVEG